MRRTLSVLTVGLSLLVLCALDGSATPARAAQLPAAAAPAPQRAAAARVTVICLRHAEKSAEAGADPGLSEAGQKRAQELARLLSAAGATHLFATPYQRTQGTLAPLARANGLAVATRDPKQLAALASELRALPAGSVAVVCGHSNTTPQLVQLLGGTCRALEQGTLPESAFDRLFVLSVACAPEAAAAAEPCAVLELRYGAGQ